MGLRRRGARFSNEIIVAQIIKRLPSIELKLNIRPTMKLTQMQDIGGCRAIVENVEQVRLLVNSFTKGDVKHKLLAQDDYISVPRESGYRGVHLIYGYNSDRSDTYNDLKIEIQIRSQLQHAWATSVEVVGTLIDQTLKSSLGDPGWLRFFQLMSSELARKESQAVVPGTPLGLSGARAELTDLIKHYSPVEKLESYRTALNYIENSRSEDHFFILHLKLKESRLVISSFKKSQSKLANERYLEVEQRIKPESEEETVLVSVDFIASLKKAYPNYFLDTKAFVEEVNRVVRLSRRST